jgi:hypothetical protein
MTSLYSYNNIIYSSTESTKILYNTTKSFKDISFTSNQNYFITSNENNLIIKSTFSETQTTSIQQTTIPICIDTSIGLLIKNTTCSNTSPYQPSFLNKQTMFNFDYPIQQLITCNTGKIILNCPTNLYLNIHSAYYGIQQNTLTSCSKSSSINNLTYPSICYRSDTYDTVYSLCQNKTNCYLYADKSYFGDPCPGFDNEQLFIQYQCVDLITLTKITNCPKITKIDSICPNLTSSSQIQRIWCDFNKISITCTIGRFINILCAVYGIDPNIRTCGFYYSGAPTSCNSYDTLVNIKFLCNYKNKCSFNYTFINNLCPEDYAPILIVQYECLTSAQMITSSISSTSFVLLESTISNYVINMNEQNICYCSSDSVFMPKILTQNGYYSFDYPIYEQIVCYGGRLNIICQENSLIHIYSAYFGIQFQTTSDCMMQNNGQNAEIPKLCYSPLSFDKIVSICEYKNSCDITATFSFLNLIETCSGFRYQNQLLIQYQCIEDNSYNFTISRCILNKMVPSICSSQVESSINQGIWCDNGLSNGSIMIIECSNNQKIEIVCAFYGKDPNVSTCGQQLSQSSICYFNSTFSILNDNCNGKNSCSVSDFKNIFLDPCDGRSDKTLFVQWKCI